MRRPFSWVPEDAVLLDEVLDDLLLVAVEPSSDDQSQQPQGLKIGRQTSYRPQLFRVLYAARLGPVFGHYGLGRDLMAEPNVRKSSGIISVALP